MNHNSIQVVSYATSFVEVPDRQEAAHKRAPVEIWEVILGIAIESPLIPYLGDDIIDIQFLFSEGCVSQRIYRRVEAIRTRLRLVCHAWNASLCKKGVKIVTQAFLGYLPQRFEALEGVQCRCHSPCVGPLSSLSTYAELVAIVSATVQVGIISNGYPVYSLLKSSPCLRALHFKRRPWSTTLNEVLQNQGAQRLTHLQLDRLTEQEMRRITAPTHLRQLRCLSLKFTIGPPGSWNSAANSATGPLKRWSMPHPQTLRLDGQLNPDFAPCMEEFIGDMPAGVTSLHMGLVYNEYVLRSGDTAITPSIWTSFPNLRTFGASMDVLVKAHPPPLPMHKQLAILTDCIWVGYDRRLDPHRFGIVAFLLTLQRWRPKEIVLLSSWEEINATWEKYQPSPRAAPMLPMEFFAAALARGIRLLDINRTTTHENSNLPFLQTLLG